MLALTLPAVLAAAAAGTCKLNHQLSSSKCTPGRTFGCSANNTMWVSGGCRGLFSCNAVPNVKCDPCDPASRCPTGAAGMHSCPCVPAPPPAPPPPFVPGETAVDVSRGEHPHEHPER